MEKKPFALLCALLALCALLNTAVFAVQEREWFLPSVPRQITERI